MKVSSEIRNLKKNLVVQIAQTTCLPDKEFILSKWNIVIQSTEDILKNGKTDVCYQELYQITNDLLLLEIPTSVQEKIEGVIIDTAKMNSQAFNALMDIQGDSFWKNFNQIWQGITCNFNLLRKILIKYEKIVYKRNIRLNSLFAVFIDALKKFIFKSNTKENFITFLVNNILDKLHSLRQKLYSSPVANYQELSKQELNGIVFGVKFLLEAGLYNDHFHDQFIDSTVNCYSSLARRLIDTKDMTIYIEFVEHALEYESLIVTSYLSEYSSKKLLSSLEVQLIENKRCDILKYFFGEQTSQQDVYLSDQKIRLLNRIYTLYKKIKIDEDLKKYWLDYINSSTSLIYSKLSGKYVEIFEHFLNLKRNIDKTIKDAYQNDEKLKSAGKEGLSKSLNLKPNYIADYFSRYVDHILTLTDADDKQIVSKLDDFMTIFRYLEAKDMFESFFIKRLANRLLYGLTTSKKGETYLIEKLKSECGTVFVTKSEEMLNDISTSSELTLNFKQDVNLHLNVNFFVLSIYSWPVTKLITGNVNEEIQAINRKFSQSFPTKFAGKTLEWHLPYCIGELSYKLNHKNVTLEVNGVQAAILLKFSKTRNEISLKNFVGLTSLDKDDLIYHLQTLSSTTNPILLYHKDKDAYMINYNYHPSKSHINVNDFSKEETSVEEIREVEERNMEDRKPVIDAHIMKNLKHKKQMKMNDLIQSVLASIKFPCEVSLINLRISHLVSNHYISICENDPEMVKYN